MDHLTKLKEIPDHANNDIKKGLYEAINKLYESIEYYKMWSYQFK